MANFGNLSHDGGSSDLIKDKKSVIVQQDSLARDYDLQAERYNKCYKINPEPYDRCNNDYISCTMVYNDDCSGEPTGWTTNDLIFALVIAGVCAGAVTGMTAASAGGIYWYT